MYSLLLGWHWLQQVRALGDYRTYSYIIFDLDAHPYRVALDDRSTIGLQEQPTGIPPEVMLNPGKERDQTEWTNAEYEELSLRKDQMNALLHQIIAEAREEKEE